MAKQLTYGDYLEFLQGRLAGYASWVPQRVYHINTECGVIEPVDLNNTPGIAIDGCSYIYYDNPRSWQSKVGCLCVNPKDWFCLEFDVVKRGLTFEIHQTGTAFGLKNWVKENRPDVWVEAQEDLPEEERTRLIKIMIENYEKENDKMIDKIRSNNKENTKLNEQVDKNCQRIDRLIALQSKGVQQESDSVSAE